MSTRVRLASVAFLLLLASASVSFAQQSDTSSTPRAGKLARHGAIGGQAGGSWFFGGGDYAKGSQPRFAFDACFRYLTTAQWGWQVDPYFTWSGYVNSRKVHIVSASGPDNPSADDYLTQVAGANAQLLHLRQHGPWLLHVGAGPALYRVVLQNNRKVVKDPVTFRKHQGTYLGATAELGAEYFLKSLPSTSLEWTLAWHTAFAKRDDQFPSGFNDSPQLVELRFGGHYYFDLVPKKKPGTTPLPGR